MEKESKPKKPAPKQLNEALRGTPGRGRVRLFHKELSLKRAEGWSNQRMADWLESTHQVKVSEEAVRQHFLRTELAPLRRLARLAEQAKKHGIIVPPAPSVPPSPPVQKPTSLSIQSKPSPPPTAGGKPKFFGHKPKMDEDEEL